MTVLPTRGALSDIGRSYGAVRTALGDMRDFLAEALGTSGEAPLITDASLLNVVSLGVKTNTPGADVQIAGGLAITHSAAASPNPGAGSLWVENALQFAPTLGSKISFPVSVGNPLELGRQVDSLYFRTKLGGSIVAYAGGSHVDAAFSPGNNGVELLRLSENSFTYKGQTVYHSGNGVFIRKDAPDTANALIKFAAGLAVPSQDVVMGTLDTPNTISRMVWNTQLLGSRLHLYNNTEDFSVGIQPSTLYFRSADKFAFYHGGVYNTGNALTPAPGTGGETLLFMSTDTLQYKGQNIYHSGNSNFVPKLSSNRPGVSLLYYNNEDTSGHVRVDFNSYGDNRARLISSGGNGAYVETRVDVANSAYNSAYDGRRLAVNETNNRPGMTRMYRCDADDGAYMQMYWDGSRYFVEGKHSNGQYAPIRVERADNCDFAHNVGSVHGHNIVDGTVRYWELSRADATATNAMRFGVHQYAFSSPVTNLPPNLYVAMGNPGNTGEARNWALLTTNNNPITGTYWVRWDYVTGSGDPYTWVTTTQGDEIASSYDAEDPFDRDNPEACPLFLESGLPDPKAVLIQYPKVEELIAVMDTQLDKISLPGWVGKHRHKDKKTPKALFRALLKDYAKERNGMQEFNQEADMNLIAFVEDLPGDSQKKNWRKQAILKVLSMLLTESAKPNLHEVLNRFYKVNKKTGKLNLK